MQCKLPKSPCKQPTHPATLREYEKHRIETDSPIRIPAYFSPACPTCDYARCLIWASDPKVLKKYLIENGKFTLKKLMRKSLYSKLMYTKSDYELFLAPLKSEMKKRNIIGFSEIIDDNTILLLTRSIILPKLLSRLLHESPEYDVINVPIPLNLTWRYYAERYTNCLDNQQEDHNTYSYGAHFSFKDASVNFTGDYQNVKRLYDMVMQY